ncbi:glycosyltransferase family 4 protein [Mucilaginibacter sp.]|jgi:glycosyltransferase involved in cell wall biosynthesis|uniref:glycosyltransferase family 4 protein n=1 Tax=Mucilaginibacter sp. TaxID=1882438 RepID=UPI0035682E74
MPKPLTIGVDIRDLQVAKTGTKTYLEELCKEFKKLNNSGLQFHFIDSSIPVYTGNNKLLKLIEHLRYQLWKQLVLPFKALFKGCDIIFCTDNIVPLIHLGYKTIPVFHDAFFFESPEHYGKLWLWLYKVTAIPAAKRSPFVITPSAYAKKQINYFTHIANEKLVVIHEGPKELSGDDVYNDTLLNQFSLKQKKYLLHAGSMFKRKNIPALIQAFGKIKDTGYPDLKLVLVGSISPANVESDHAQILLAIKKNNLHDDVIFTGYLSDKELAHVYKNALMYMFPSLNEGFGIPVLEAFQYNLPVLAANNTSLPEVGGDAALQFDPFDVNDIFAKIKIVLDNSELRENMIIKGQERLKKFSWEKAALELVDVFRKAV